MFFKNPLQNYLLFNQPSVKIYMFMDMYDIYIIYIYMCMYINIYIYFGQTTIE